MIKKLTFSKTDLSEPAGNLVLVTFLDDEGNTYQWAPGWAEVEQLFSKRSQSITSAHKVTGTLASYDGGKLIVDTSDGEHSAYFPAFEVTENFLDLWLSISNYITFFVVNDMVIRLNALERLDYNRTVFLEYPPTEQ